jgi:hypothetical protein
MKGPNDRQPERNNTDEAIQRSIQGDYETDAIGRPSEQH